MKLTRWQEGAAIRVAEKGFPPTEIARIIGAPVERVRGFWRTAQDRIEAIRALDRPLLEVKVSDNAPVYLEGSASAWQPHLVTIALPKRLSMAGVEKIVCTYFGVSGSAIRGQSRYARLVIPRHVAFLMCREFFDGKRSLPEIGRHFGGRDHTTVMHGIRSIADKMRVNPDLLSDVEQIRELIRREYFSSQTPECEGI